MVSASGISKTILLSSDTDEFCDRFKLLVPKKQAGFFSDKINQENVAIVHNLLDYKCISKK